MSNSAPSTSDTPANTVAAPGGAPATPGRRPSDIASLTGLRFFAAFLVFMAHASLLSDPLDFTKPINFYGDQTVAHDLARVFAPAGYVGVSFFFVLSGFVLTWSWRPGGAARPFWRRRLFKIFPNHIVVWGLALALFAHSYTPMRVWLPNLFLVHSYIPRPDTDSSVNVPAWSLCSELLFYLLFPLLIRGVLRIREQRLWLWAGGAVLGMAGVALTAEYVIPAGVAYPLAPMPLTKMWFAYLFPPSRLFEFILGMLLARIVAAGRFPRIGVLPVLTLAALGYTGAVELPAPYIFNLTTIVPIAAIIGTAARAHQHGTRSWLGSPLLVWLGTVSFGFYMFQAVPIFYGRLKVFGGHTYSTPTATGLLVLLFLSVLLGGWLLNYFVEMPIMRRWSRARRPAADPGEPVPAPALNTGAAG